jgi:integrase
MAIKEITPKAVLDQRAKVKLGTFIQWHEKHTSPVPTAKGGPGCANDLVEYGSMVCSYAGLSAPGQNPFKGIDAFPTGEPREKLVIEPTLWPRIYKALQRRSYRERLVFWTACLMGARPLAAARMKWARLDLEQGSYHLTADKLECAGWKPSTSPEWKYPVDDWLLSMLREQKEWVKPDEVWVFPSNQSK